MKLASWNVNGIRSVQKKGFIDWFRSYSADVVCLQEIKAQKEQLTETELLHPENYHSYWYSAVKPGYSGLVSYSRKEPESIDYGIGDTEIDNEGRVLTLHFKNFSIVNSYFPNSQRDHARLDYKLRFCSHMLNYLENLRSRSNTVLLCGDFNIAHKEIDLKNPKSNQDNAGFLPEERAWMDELLGKGYIDTFRHFEKGPNHYTWWSYRPGVREKNVGWRLDYFVCDPESGPRLKSAGIQAQVKGSDHCPVHLEIKS